MKLNQLTINSYNRQDAYESHKQFIKTVQDYSIKTSQFSFDKVEDVFSLMSLPPKHQLMRWSTELSLRNNIASGIHYVECNLGKFLYESVQHLIALHRVQEIKLAVDQELTWFNSPKLVPKSIGIFPPQNLIEKFKEVLFRKPASTEISEYGMNPNTLAELCCTRWLSSDHMMQISCILNSIQSHSKVIYFNFIGNIEHYVSRLTSVPIKLIFIINVGGNNEKTFSGTDFNPGSHWAFAVYNNIECSFYYGDSLGWSVPDDFLCKVKLLIRKLYHLNKEVSITYCHDPKTHRYGVKKCSSLCRGNYPMQTCGNICGVITIIICAISCLNYDYFVHIISNDKRENNNYIFLQEPTKYSKYLRLVLMSWFISKEINLDFVVPALGKVSSSFEVPSNEDFKYTNVSESSLNKNIIVNIESNNFSSLKCAFCNVTFTKKKNMQRHIKNKHKLINEAQAYIQSGISFCLECGFQCRQINGLRKHLSAVHFYTFQEEKLSFSNFKEFDLWKSDIESNNSMQYVLPSGEKLDKNGRKVSYYQCNRSGFYKSMAKKRIAKSSGTRKIAKNCTSTLKVYQNLDGTILVHACYSHYGHSNEIQHISLSSAQRLEIASKLKMGVTKDRILDDIRDEMGSVQSRLHLTQYQDIKNLEKAFNINSIQLHANDQDSVAIWLKEWQMKENNHVLHYKLQGESDTFNKLKDADFIIIMQTEHQKKILQQFGKNGVCIDSTHGTNAYDFLLTTILVIDEFGEGQPVGWCISNSDSFRFLKLFFIKLKEHSGNFCPIWIMSDMASQYYEAFCDAYLCEPLKFWCTWHVDKAWREELHKKIHNIEMEADIYKRIRFLLQLSDRNLFDDYLQLLMNYLQSSDLTQLFAEYFEKYWVSNKQNWAFCYRMGLGINTNMYVESFHKVFKYSYLQGKHNKRIDNCLFALLKFNRDKVYERIIKLTKGKISFKLKMVHSRHIASLQLNESFTLDDKGARLVQSETNACLYRVLKHQELCEINECLTKCPECKVCAHLYSCDCMDFLTKNIPCKHIHLIHRLSRVCETKKNEPIHLPTHSIELECKVVKGCEPADINILKNTIIKNLNNLVNLVTCSTVSDEEGLKSLHKNISLAQNTFLNLTTNKQNELHFKSNVPSNTQITKQSPFYSTKKKRKTSNIRLAKPSADEIDSFLDFTNWNLKIKDSQLQSSSKLKKPKLETQTNCIIKKNILSPDQKKILEFFGYRKSHTNHMLTENELNIDTAHLSPEIINHDITIIQSLIYPEVFVKVKKKRLFDHAYSIYFV